MAIRCRVCGSNDVEDDGPIANPEIPEDPEWKKFGRKYKDMREDAKNFDREFIYDKSMDYEDKEVRLKARKLWYKFHDLKYGKGGRKCPASAFIDCVMFAYDPENYPWDRPLLVEDWWEANKPA